MAMEKWASRTFSLCLLILFLMLTGGKGQQSECEDRWFGDKCQYQCHCLNDAVCDKTTGECPGGCDVRWFGPQCQYWDATYARDNVALTDGDDSTCPSPYGGLSQDFPMSKDAMFTWMRFVTKIPSQGYKNPNCRDNRSGIVQLFEWRWGDIAFECENFLGPNGFCAVQTSPPSENRITMNPYRPWHERYQPVSYKLITRSGNDADFRDMVKRCNAVGVQIFADTVFNHMAAGGGRGPGTGGSDFDSDKLSFPAVPYSSLDFNDASMCHSYDGLIHNYQNKEEVRNCKLVGLNDLKLSSDYVRDKVAGYLNYLIDVGVTGFRVDAAKHMWPEDMRILFSKVKDLKNGGGRPFIYQEVIDRGGEVIKGDEYLQTGRITNFKYCGEMAMIFRKQNPMKYLGNFGFDWFKWQSGDVVNFLDNHDNQRDDGGVLTHKESRAYKLASAFMLAHPYGVPRIMSSYSFSSRDEGPPHNGDGSIKPVIHNGNLCSDGWVCEHRWRQIYNMIAFRNIASGTGVNNFWAGADYQIAFSRGDKAFIALNLEDRYIDTTLQTGLPAGEYCDVISGEYLNGSCTGKTVRVNGDGTAHITVPNNTEDPMVAIHLGAKVGDPPRKM